LENDGTNDIGLYGALKKSARATVRQPRGLSVKIGNMRECQNATHCFKGVIWQLEAQFDRDTGGYQLFA